MFRFQLKQLHYKKWSSNFIVIHVMFMHPGPPGEAYRDRRLTTNFELWVEFFLCTEFPCEDSKTVSVCLSVRLSIYPYPEKRNHHSFVNISPTLVIDTSVERSSRLLHHRNPKNLIFFFKKVRNSNFDLWRISEITL